MMKAEKLYAGVELGGTKCVCVLATESGTILKEERVPTEHPDITLPALKAILRVWFATEPSIAAMGVAAFGPIDVDTTSPDWGRVGQTSKPHWSGVQVARELSDGFGVPCALDTDVNGAALAEMRWGAAQGLTDFAYVTVGTGVGVGLICDGKSVRGFGHGEAGHMRVPRAKGDDWDGNCPYHGDCVEGLAAGPAIAARTGKMPRLIAPDDASWDLVGHAIAHMLHNLVLTTTPRRIFIGGGVATAQPQLFSIVRRELGRSLAGYMTSRELDDLDTYVVQPGLGALAGPLGPIALATGVARTAKSGNLRLAM
jgi:fructokinase